MKNLKLCLLITVISFSFSYRELNENLNNNFITIDGNNIIAFYKNNGIFNNNFNAGGGFEWPAGSGITARWTSGLWIGTVAGDDTISARVGYGASDFIPGYIDNTGMPQGQSDSTYRIYKIVRGDTTGKDYLNWPANQGAYLNEFGKPFTLGTQTMFYVNNDAIHNWSGDSSLKAQILNTVWAYSNNNLLRNVIFMEYKIINRSHKIWNNTYAGIFTDDDLGSLDDDNIGVDTIRSLGYTYNYTNHDPIYGENPPAVGFSFVRGPYTFTGNNSDTIKYYDPPGSANLKVKIGYKRMTINSFQYFNEGGPEPDFPLTAKQVYRVLFGTWRHGDHWINPTTNQPTKFAFSGDPVTGTGWVANYSNDMRFMQSTGPFTMNPGDTQSVIVAQLIARGSSNLNSITKLRETADLVKQTYDENFQSVVSVNNSSIEVPEEFSLSQNYPNPFNPVTVIRYNIPTTGKGQTSNVKLIIYNILGSEVKTLVNEKQNAGNYDVVFNASGLPSGVYLYKLEAGEFNQTHRMVLLK